jgi:hypothetical protein
MMRLRLVRLGQRLSVVPALLLCHAARGNSGIQLPLSQYQAGAEQTTPVNNGTFESPGALDGTGNYPNPTGWTRSGNMYVGAPTFSNTNNTGAFAAQLRDNVSPGSYQQNVGSLGLDRNYVLSAYVWNAGRPDPSGFGSGELATVKLVDPNNGFNNISMSLEGNASDGGPGGSGYFMYIMANEAQMRAWSGVAVQVIGEEGTVAGAIPTTWAQFDNVSLTPAANFGGQKWNSAGGGNWTDGTKWLGNHAPNAAGAVASFFGGTSGATSISVNAPVTVGMISFDSANSYTVSGSNAITLDVTADGFGSPQGVPEITAVSGSHTVSAPISLPRSTIVSAAGGATLTLSGAVTAATGVTISKAGAGTVRMSNVRADGLNVNAGVLAVIPNGTSAATSNVKTLTIAGATNAWTAKLDLGDNAMVIDYPDGGPTPFDTVQNQIKSGYNGGSWNGNGIVTSIPLAASGKTAIGYRESPGAGTFRGQTVDGSAVLMRYTLSGDSDLSGTVDLTDFTFLAANFNGTGKNWLQGDYNYDGKVDLTDFTFLASNFNQSIPAVGGGLGTTVPEPSAVLLAAGACAFACARRSRRARGDA